MFRQISFLLILIFFSLGLYLGVHIGAGKVKVLNKYFSEFAEVRQRGNYKYINPLLECESKSGGDSSEFETYKAQLTAIINEKIAAGKVSDVGIYYRDLNNGPTFGVNGESTFAPASLFKVPVMLAYFKLAEKDPAILNNTLTYQNKVDIGQVSFFGKDTTLEQGTEYTVNELIERMIIYSDNQALFLLGENISQKKIDQVTKDLGVTTPNPDTPDNFMTVKSYSSLFRILYNASYFDKDLSEKALQILSKSQFKVGLVAGLPKNVTVAHKFGEREIDENTKQLHDCGIVYYPGHPYLICVMTRGNNYEEQASLIKEVSENIFSEMDRRYKK